MKRLSAKLRGYSGANPFRESQARTYGDSKIVSEFCPTSFYWSLFNEQHEILLGTRGSGKTVLMKMLTYSLLKRFHDDQAQKHIQEKNFIGFYVPLHLEFLDALQNSEASDSQKISYFQFAVNCAAAMALLDQLPELLLDCFETSQERFLAESTIVDHLKAIWFPESKPEINSIKDIQWNINIIYNTYEFPPPQKKENVQGFSRSLLSPITGVLRKLTEDLRLDFNKTNWIICIDEAEFLQEPFIKCINTFLRSEKRPLVVKIATLPFKHSTRETIHSGIFIEPNGSDFNYRKIDLEWDSVDFKRLTDHLCRIRLHKCGLTETNLTLESFLGAEGNDDAIDYYRLEMGGKEANRDKILEGLLDALSNKRRDHYANIQDDRSKVQRPLEHRFTPVYIVRKMKIKEHDGNRTVGWFAGAPMVRRITDGNPRRFIQIMNDMVEKARGSDLTPKNQHRVLRDFASRNFTACEGLPKYGLTARNIISKIGDLLSERVHGIPMKDGGCNFYLDRNLLENTLIRHAIELAIAYSYLITDNESLFDNIKENSNLRLAYICAVYFWLPMRKGDSPIIRHADTLLGFQLPNMDAVPTTRKEADTVFSQLKLELMERSE
jgi:hypothetical protein